MPPDLSAGAAWLEGRSLSARKQAGQWSTPWWLCEAGVAAVIDALPPGGTVLDPACGDGRWLVAAGRARPDARLIGVDLDPDAVAAARATLQAAGLHAELLVADALAPASPVPHAHLILGNPPYIRPQKLAPHTRRDLWSRFHTATDKADLYACFVERALQIADAGLLVLPDTWMHLNSFAALRAAVRPRVHAVWGLPARTFPGARVFSCALHFGPAAAAVPLAGTLDPSGPNPSGPLAFGDHAWSLSGPLPELPGRPLGEAVHVHMGVLCGDQSRYVGPTWRSPLDRPTCRGQDVARWTIHPPGLWLRYAPDEMLAEKPNVAPKHAGLFDVPEKIVLSGTSGRRLHAAMDEERLFPLDSCYVLHAKAPEVDLWAVLGFLLSAPVGAWYAARHRAARVKGVEIARIPLPERGWAEVAAAARARDEVGLEVAVRAAYGLT